MELVANGSDYRGSVPATYPTLPDMGGPDVVRKPRVDSDTADLTIIGRASQKAVDFSLIWTRCGISGAAFIAVCFAAYWCIPWWGENISKPESVAKIASGKMTAEAMVAFADASKSHADNEKALIIAEERREKDREQIVSSFQAISEMSQGMLNELKRINEKLDSRK